MKFTRQTQSGERRLPWLIAAVALGAVGCQGWNRVELERTFGFCDGYCISTASLNTSASGSVAYQSRDTALPRLSVDVAYPTRAAELDGAVGRALSITWADRYGCPDCVDQGSYVLTIDDGGSTRKTNLDPDEHPAAFDPLLAFFADVFAEHGVPACMVGMDQTCNDDPATSALWGQCTAGACQCHDGFEVNPRTGRCRSVSTTDCYSPTQNVDSAYDANFIGCACDATVDVGVCVTDSGGRNVALVCENARWQSVLDGPCGL